MASNSVVALCVDILTKYSKLRAIDNNNGNNNESIILLYRDVLTLLANTLQYEINDYTNQNGHGKNKNDDSDEENDIPIIFSTKLAKNVKSNAQGRKHTSQTIHRDRLSLSFLQQLAAVIRPVMLNAVCTVGDDVA